MKRGTAEPQTALSAEKEAITLKKNKLGVAGGCWRGVKCVCVCVCGVGGLHAGSLCQPGVSHAGGVGGRG